MFQEQTSGRKRVKLVFVVHSLYERLFTGEFTESVLGTCKSQNSNFTNVRDLIFKLQVRN